MTERGLPYGWWKNPDFWALVLGSIMVGGILALLLGAWWLR